MVCKDMQRYGCKDIGPVAKFSPTHSIIKTQVVEFVNHTDTHMLIPVT